MSDPTDKELFEQAISDTPTQEPIAEAPEQRPEGKVEDGLARDEKGRFAAKTEQPLPEREKTSEAQVSATQPEKREEAQVPSWRLREVNEAKDAAERRASDMFSQMQGLRTELSTLQRELQQKQQPPVDFFADPGAAMKQHLAPLENQFQNTERKMIFRASRAESLAYFGKDAVTEMENAIEQAVRDNHPGIDRLSKDMRESDDPVGVAMTWYRHEKLLKETGGDLGVYKSKMLDEALKDPAFLSKAIEAAKAQASAQPNSKATVQLPPSLSRAGSAASPHEDPGDLSDRSLYSYATR